MNLALYEEGCAFTPPTRGISKDRIGTKNFMEIPLVVIQRGKIMSVDQLWAYNITIITKNLPVYYINGC
jgi:hypothetical protein